MRLFIILIVISLAELKGQPLTYKLSYAITDFCFWCCAFTFVLLLILNIRWNRTFLYPIFRVCEIFEGLVEQGQYFSVRGIALIEA